MTFPATSAFHERDDDVTGSQAQTSFVAVAAERPKSCSTVQPSDSATASAAITDGTKRPPSMAVIAVREIPARSASCDCVQPRRIRSALT